MKHMRTKRTISDLQIISDQHLFYEIEMLVGSAVVLTKIQSLASQILVNSLIESFVIHLRNLLDFLYSGDISEKLTKKPPHRDDVIAEDFFDDPSTWQKDRPKKSDTLKAAHVRAHKEVAHLTYDRLNQKQETKGWKYNELLNEINLIVQTFIRLVPKDRVGDNFKAMIGTTDDC